MNAREAHPLPDGEDRGPRERPGSQHSPWCECSEAQSWRLRLEPLRARRRTEGGSRPTKGTRAPESGRAERRSDRLLALAPDGGESPEERKPESEQRSRLRLGYTRKDRDTRLRLVAEAVDRHARVLEIEAQSDPPVFRGERRLWRRRDPKEAVDDRRLRRNDRPGTADRTARESRQEIEPDQREARRRPDRCARIQAVGDCAGLRREEVERDRDRRGTCRHRDRDVVDSVLVHVERKRLATAQRDRDGELRGDGNRLRRSGQRDGDDASGGLAENPASAPLPSASVAR